MATYPPFHQSQPYLSNNGHPLTTVTYIRLQDGRCQEVRLYILFLLNLLKFDNYFVSFNTGRSWHFPFRISQNTPFLLAKILYNYCFLLLLAITFQKKLKTMLVQIFGGQASCGMGTAKAANKRYNQQVFYVLA